MIGMGDKFRRVGAFVIDVMIAKMFTQVLVMVMFYFLSAMFKGGKGLLSLNDPMALPILLGLIIVVILLFIAVYIGYCRLCFKLIGTSLAKYFLQVTVGSRYDDAPMSTQAYQQRELEKIALVCITMGLYAFYSGAQWVMFDRVPLHEQRSLARLQATL